MTSAWRVLTKAHIAVSGKCLVLIEELLLRFTQGLRPVDRLMFSHIISSSHLRICRFLDMLERYFEQPDEAKAADVRKEMHYQVGTTPEHVELPRDHCERMKAFKDADKPLSLCPPEKDPKSRFFWRLGELPVDTEFPALNAAPVIPAAFPEWSDVSGRDLGVL